MIVISVLVTYFVLWKISVQIDEMWTSAVTGMCCVYVSKETVAM